jgi:hypothetical protein
MTAWNIAPYSIDINRRFRCAYCFHHQGDEWLSETSAYFNETTWRYIPQGCHIPIRRRENLKSHNCRFSSPVWQKFYPSEKPSWTSVGEQVVITEMRSGEMSHYQHFITPYTCRNSGEWRLFRKRQQKRLTVFRCHLFLEPRGANMGVSL